jgi:hypothetical protein
MEEPEYYTLHQHVNIEGQMGTAAQLVFRMKRMKVSLRVGLAAPNRWSTGSCRVTGWQSRLSTISCNSDVSRELNK